MTFKELINNIDMNLYLRCHNGFIINKLKIKSVSSKEVELFDTDKKIPIGRSYKKEIDIFYRNEKIKVK